MKNTIPTSGTISWRRRIMTAAAACGLLLAFGFAQPASAQTSTNPLTLTNNYFVTGDYVVAGWQKDATIPITTINAVPYATGNINVPDTFQASQGGIAATPVPAGADIVAAFLYWETVESTVAVPANPGINGFFNGYAISGSFLPSPTPNAPTSWSAGGCSGGSMGAKTIQGYRADVRPFLPVNTNGQIQGNGTFQVQLADSGSNGSTVPFTLGATLVIVYRVQSPLVALNSIILYDGTFAPSNALPGMSQQIVGFYQAAGSPVSKITYIVGNGQPNKLQTVSLNNVNLPSLYPSFPNTPFPGIYNGSWDSPTWVPNKYGMAVQGNDASETTSVIPIGKNNTNNSNGGCVNWGAVVFSTTVQNSDNDALLDVWKKNTNPGPGYIDALSNQFVKLPGAVSGQKDIFVEIDYLSNLDGLAGPYLHSHLPKQAALDMVGDAFKNQGVHVHFDVGNVYQTALPGGPSVACGAFQCDPYIVPAGIGGNSISESVSLCNDATSPTLCPFPGTPAVAWKGGFLSIKNDASVANSNPPIPLGNFQLGRKDSYHYVLFGHALGVPRTFWTSFAGTLQGTSFAKLISIVNAGTTATVTIQTPQGLLKPGDCPNLLIPACSDANVDRVTVGGALGQLALNGTYHFSNLSSSTTNNIVTTTFNIATTNTTATCTVAPCVANATYNFNNEPRLAVTYGGPGSTSGHSDVGGGDTAVTFGLWLTDDVPGCQADPSGALAPGQVYCTNQVGTITGEGGTLLHELGHTLFLTHGGTYFNDPNNPFLPTYGVNCKSNFLSSMNYLFQIRGFPDGGIDYSGQTLPNLGETNLSEPNGIGPAAHFTRWYAPPSALDTQLGRIATLHCDGTPIMDGATMARVDGSALTEPSGFSGAIDWNNDGSTTDTGLVQDINFNNNFFNSPSGSNVDSPFAGFNDWINVDLRQVGSRANASGFSSGGVPADLNGGGTPPDLNGGGTPPDLNGGGTPPDLNGGGVPADLNGGGTPPDLNGGGTEQDENATCSTADPPDGLMASQMPKVHSVNLNWTPPGVCLVSRKAGYTIWRAVGFFSTLTPANRTQFTPIATVNAPSTTFTDINVKNNTTYTYFVQDTNTHGATSGASNLAQIFVSF